MKMLVTACAAAIFGSAISLTVAGQAQTAKTPSAVAYVSASRIYTDSVHGRAEAGRIQSLQQQKSGELRTKSQALEATRQQLSSTADPTARVALQQKEMEQRADVERTAAQAQVEIQTLQREVNGDLQRRVRVILDELMKTQSYQLVLNSDASLTWMAPELDLTSAVVARMNGR